MEELLELEFYTKSIYNYESYHILLSNLNLFKSLIVHIRSYEALVNLIHFKTNIFPNARIN